MYSAKEVFDRIANRMKEEFQEARAALDHPGQKGSSNEDIVRGFLKTHLPKNLGITTGTIIDSLGTSSKQQDIIIYDAQRTPILYESQSVQVLPVLNFRSL